jgi:hypothetical protein
MINCTLICNTCGSACEELQTHHILPKALGGTDLATNLIDICLGCHSKIHSRSMTHSALTKLGLARAKAAGKKLGGYREGHTKHHEAVKTNADAFAKLIGPKIAELRQANKTYSDIAKQFNEEAVPTRLGGAWYGTTVRNAHKRYETLCFEENR